MKRYIIKGELVRELLTFLGKIRDHCGEETSKKASILMAKLGEGWKEDVDKYYELKVVKNERKVFHL